MSSILTSGPKVSCSGSTTTHCTREKTAERQPSTAVLCELCRCGWEQVQPSYAGTVKQQQQQLLQESQPSTTQQQRQWQQCNDQGQQQQLRQQSYLQQHKSSSLRRPARCSHTSTHSMGKVLHLQQRRQHRITLLTWLTFLLVSNSVIFRVAAATATGPQQVWSIQQAQHQRTMFLQANHRQVLQEGADVYPSRHLPGLHMGAAPANNAAAADTAGMMKGNLSMASGTEEAAAAVAAAAATNGPIGGTAGVLVDSGTTGIAAATDVMQHRRLELRLQQQQQPKQQQQAQAGAALLVDAADVPLLHQASSSTTPAAAAAAAVGDVSSSVARPASHSHIKTAAGGDPTTLVQSSSVTGAFIATAAAASRNTKGVAAATDQLASGEGPMAGADASIGATAPSGATDAATPATEADRNAAGDPYAAVVAAAYPAAAGATRDAVRVTPDAQGAVGVTPDAQGAVGVTPDAQGAVGVTPDAQGAVGVTPDAQGAVGVTPDAQGAVGVTPDAQGTVGITPDAQGTVVATEVVVGDSDVSSSSGGDGGGGGGRSTSQWKPQVLEAPVPKWPRLYAAMAPPAPNLPSPVRHGAASALIAAARAAKTPQGISIRGVPGLTLEDKILLARILGHEVRGDFDEAGRMDPTAKEYWDMLEAQLEQHTSVKHMFESIWYKCSKLNADLVNRASTAYDMELEALQHILAWLGLQERQLPRPGEYASFDELVLLLKVAGANARLVTDPVPYLATERPHLDRNGMPMLIHMTFKDKGQFARHHILSLASWAKENPDHAILMYDDADLEAYLSTYDASVLELYSGLKTAVERSDLWRYVVMCKHGGVYTDADTLCVRPIQEWNSENHNDAEALFGVEDVFRRDPNSGSSGWGVSSGRFGIQFEQWTLAGAPHHPVYCNMHSFISQRIVDEASKQAPPPPPGTSSESENWSILHRTGPHVWTDSVLNWMHSQGIGFHEALVPGGRLVANSTRIMPGETFGCAAHFFSPAARLEEVYAMHMFRGVWRKRLDSGGQEDQERKLLSGPAMDRRLSGF